MLLLRQSARTSGLLSDASAETVSPAVRDGVRQTEKIEIVARNKRARKEGTDTENRRKNGAAPDDSEILTLCLFGPTFRDSHEPGRNYVPVTSIPTENHSQINEMSKSSAAPARAILSGPSNWDKWRRELRNRTDKTIHSLIFTNEDPLEPPERPEFRHYAPDAVRLADLSAESVVSSKQNAFDEDLPIRQWFKRLEASTAPEAGYMMNLTGPSLWITPRLPVRTRKQDTRRKIRGYPGKLFDFDRYGPPAAAPVNPVVHNPAAAAVAAMAAAATAAVAAVLAAQAPTESQWTVERVVRDVKHLAESREAENPRCYQRGGAFHADKAAADADDADEVPPAKKKKLDREPLERSHIPKEIPALPADARDTSSRESLTILYSKENAEIATKDEEGLWLSKPSFQFNLLDCGASLHINNKLSRFRSFKKAKNDFIVAGFGRVNVATTMPDGSHRTLRLKKVAYCPGFSSSLVSLQTLIDDDQIFWDTLSEPMRLVRKGQTIGITERKYQQFVVEYQPVETEFPDFNRKLEEPAQEILDLPLKETASFGTPVLVTLYCAQGKVRRQVSRRPPDEERDKPCYEIWIDWTDLARDHENYVRVMFITDAFSGMTYKAKEHGAVLKDFSSFMLARFGFKTNLFTKKISAWMRKKGMTKAMSASNTQDQNGGAERIASRLPHSLWKEIIEAACYLRNRTPREPRFAAENANEGEADWKEEKSAHIFLGLRKRWKLDPRAHIGYLIGYKDVVFDEYTFFEGGGERMPLPASIGEMIQQIEIPEDQTANQAILDEETDEDTDIEDLEDDDIRMAEDNEVEEQGQQQSEEQEKEDYGRARELEDAYLTPPASDPEEEPHGVFSVHFPYADPNGVVVKAPFQVDLEPLQAQKRRRLTLRADLEGLMKESRLKALEPFDQPELDQSYIDRFADFVPVPIEDGVHGAFTAGRLFRPKSAKVHKRDLPEPPQTQKQLEKHPYREEFTQAQRDHLASHAEMGSFDEVFWTKAAGKQVLGCKWVFIYKTDKHGNLQSAKLASKGDLPTRATTLAGMSFRTLMAIAAKHDLELEQMDAKRGKVLRLRKALYGLRRSPLLWQQMLTSSLEELGFRKVPRSPVTVFFYVDDIIWAFRKEDEGVVEEATRGLQKKINLTRLGEPRWFLGFTLWLTQDAYIDKIAYKFLLNNDNALKLLPATSQANERKNITISTRPDIAFAVSRLARHNHNPDEKHQKAADRVILFLFATRSYALRLGGGSKEAELFLYNSVDRKSSQGYVMTLFGGSVAWRASKQATAELLALSEASKEAIFLSRLLNSLDIRIPSPRSDFSKRRTFISIGYDKRFKMLELGQLGAYDTYASRWLDEGIAEAEAPRDIKERLSREAKLEELRDVIHPVIAIKRPRARDDNVLVGHSQPGHSQPGRQDGVLGKSGAQPPPTIDGGVRQTEKIEIKEKWSSTGRF
ncbi:reverse transcriptase (RNA-dependent DNA polymerase) [Hirsutella rhossiliensis]